jgi:hypothetical protein
MEVVLELPSKEHEAKVKPQFSRIPYFLLSYLTIK